jgi:hypothetical protein
MSATSPAPPPHQAPSTWLSSSHLLSFSSDITCCQDPLPNFSSGVPSHCVLSLSFNGRAGSFVIQLLIYLSESLACLRQNQLLIAQCLGHCTESKNTCWTMSDCKSLSMPAEGVFTLSPKYWGANHYSKADEWHIKNRILKLNLFWNNFKSVEKWQR